MEQIEPAAHDCGPSGLTGTRPPYAPSPGGGAGRRKNRHPRMPALALPHVGLAVPGQLRRTAVRVNTDQPDRGRLALSTAPEPPSLVPRCGQPRRSRARAPEPSTCLLGSALNAEAPAPAEAGTGASLPQTRILCGVPTACLLY